MSDLEVILTALARSQAAYLVVGGVAVVLHGHPRLTADLDLAIRLDRENVDRIVGALEELGFRPRVPVQPTDLAVPERREEWIREKNMVVLSFWSPRFPVTEIDLFVREYLDFDAAYARAHRANLDGTIVTVASLPDLVALKRRSGRTRDLDDIEALEAIAKELNDKG